VRRAVVHLNPDPAGELDLPALERTVLALRAAGHEVIAGDLDRLPPTRREVELLLSGDDPQALRAAAERACAAALAAAGAAGARPRAAAVGFLSAGRLEDALGIVRAFGLERRLRECRLEGEELAVLVLEPGTSAPAGLATALEAALNREVRFVGAGPGERP